jgi:hypothetical protein
MSRAYSDTTNKDGILQGIEQILFGETGDGRITGNTTLKAMFTGEINQSLDDAHSIIFAADGTWQFDDRNHTDYPIITTNLVSGQRDYAFTVDGSSNLILEIQRVLIADASGNFTDIKPKDAQKDEVPGFYDGNDTQGTPIYYDKTANGIFLDPIPSYNSTGGLKIYISREGSYFTTSDTTKTPGIAGLFHEYFVVAPAYKYAYRNNMSNVSFLLNEKVRIEEAMKDYYSRRNQDEVARLTATKHNNR